MITPGMFLGERYEIIEKIGSGGMADVYKAKCHRLNRMVAIKFLKPEYSSDPKCVTNFRKEAESCAGLTHPNIVSVYDVGDEGDLHYIVMELVEGITLKRYIEKRGQLDLKEAIGIAIQIAQGLEAAHAKHVVHRDIKPQNIILSREGKVKVADFGIARATTSNTIQELAIGSVHYLSPEQARGGYSDERSDIYSLGITMYEMLAGKLPFVGDSNVSVAIAQINNTAEPISEINPNISPAVEKIVRKCMSKKPERRYQAVGELIADLKLSVNNPEGDFVKTVSTQVSDSPTKQISGPELKQIKNGAKVGLFDDDDTDDEDEDPKKAAVAVRRRIDDDPDDDIDYVGNLWEKVGLISSILLMVAVAIIVVMIVNKTTGIFNRNNTGNLINPTKHVTSTPTPTEIPKKAVMPNLVGQTYISAYAQLMELGLDLRIDQKPAEVASKDIPEDSVCEQSPLEGADLTVGSIVVLTLSIGKGNMKVPDVKGMPIDKARLLLEQLNVTEEGESDDSEIGTVLRTNPVANTEVKKGSEIIVYVSTGPEMVTIPRVIGMTLANAEKTIKAEELKYEIIEEYSDVEAGVVFEQSPGDNTSVKKGFKVSIYVSKGPEPTPSPTPTPSPEPTPSPTPTPIPTPTEDVAPPDNQGSEGE